MVHPAHGAFETGLEFADMQQRVRVAVDTLSGIWRWPVRALYIGRPRRPADSLLRAGAAVSPRRVRRDDAPGTFRTDAITIISVPSTAAQTTLAADLAVAELDAAGGAQPGCPAGISLCGFAPGMTVARLRRRR